MVNDHPSEGECHVRYRNLQGRRQTARRPAGRWGVVAGPAFHNFDVDAAARDAYQNDLGVQLQDVKVKTSFAVRPEIGATMSV